MFKKLMTFYKKNRVYSILMLISIVCIVSILIGVIVYFLGQVSKDVYGSRLEGIDSIKITENKKSDIKESVQSDDKVNSVDVDVRGKLVYVVITLKEGNHADAEALALKTLEAFGEKEKAYYDIQFIVENKSKTEDNFPIMGYIKAGNSVIKWTNYLVK